MSSFLLYWRVGGDDADGVHDAAARPHDAADGDHNDVEVHDVQLEAVSQMVSAASFALV